MLSIFADGTAVSPEAILRPDLKVRIWALDQMESYI
jgi:hypothetical protein